VAVIRFDSAGNYAGDRDRSKTAGSVHRTLRMCSRRSSASIRWRVSARFGPPLHGRGRGPSPRKYSKPAIGAPMSPPPPAHPRAVTVVALVTASATRGKTLVPAQGRSTGAAIPPNRDPSPLRPFCLFCPPPFLPRLQHSEPCPILHVLPFLVSNPLLQCPLFSVRGLLLNNTGVPSRASGDAAVRMESRIRSRLGR